MFVSYPRADNPARNCSIPPATDVNVVIATAFTSAAATLKLFPWP
jgi:hypothetical protein